MTPKITTDWFKIGLYTVFKSAQFAFASYWLMIAAGVVAPRMGVPTLSYWTAAWIVLTIFILAQAVREVDWETFG